MVIKQGQELVTLVTMKVSIPSLLKLTPSRLTVTL